MNISGNLKSLASWCTGFNNAESAWKVCKEDYFFNTDEHEKPTLTAKAKQLCEEGGKIFLKYASIYGVISLPFTDMGYINPIDPNTISGIFQHLSKIPYCLVKSALKMNSDFCTSLPVNKIINNIPKPSIPAPRIPVHKIPAPSFPVQSIPIPSILNTSIPVPSIPTPSIPQVTILPEFQEYAPISYLKSQFTKNNALYAAGLFNTALIFRTSLSQIKWELTKSPTPRVQKNKNIAEHVTAISTAIFINIYLYQNPSAISPMLYAGLTGGILRCVSSVTSQDKISSLIVPVIFYFADKEEYFS